MHSRHSLKLQRTQNNQIKNKKVGIFQPFLFLVFFMYFKNHLKKSRNHFRRFNNNNFHYVTSHLTLEKQYPNQKHNTSKHNNNKNVRYKNLNDSPQRKAGESKTDYFHPIIFHLAPPSTLLWYILCKTHNFG